MLAVTGSEEGTGGEGTGGDGRGGVGRGRGGESRGSFLSADPSDTLIRLLHWLKLLRLLLLPRLLRLRLLRWLRLRLLLRRPVQGRPLRGCCCACRGSALDSTGDRRPASPLGAGLGCLVPARWDAS